MALVRSEDVKHRDGLTTLVGTSDALMRAIRRKRLWAEDEVITLDFLQRIFPYLCKLPEGPAMSHLLALIERWSGLEFTECHGSVSAWLKNWDEKEMSAELVSMMNGNHVPGRWDVYVERSIPMGDIPPVTF